MNSFFVNSIPFFLLIQLIKRNHEKKGFNLRPIKLFNLFIFFFEVFDAVFTIPMNTTSLDDNIDISERVTSILFVVVDISRAIISLIIMFIIFKMTSNESNSNSFSEIEQDDKNKFELLI